MNAAGRLVHQNLITRHFISMLFLIKQRMLMTLLAFAVVFSAISVIYVTHHSRVLHAEIEHQLIERDRLQSQRAQLLLERGTWMMQARIQKYAEKKLEMVIPSHESIVVIHE